MKQGLPGMFPLLLQGMECYLIQHADDHCLVVFLFELFTESADLFHVWLSCEYGLRPVKGFDSKDKLT